MHVVLQRVGVEVELRAHKAGQSQPSAAGGSSGVGPSSRVPPVQTTHPSDRSPDHPLGVTLPIQPTPRLLHRRRHVLRHRPPLDTRHQPLGPERPGQGRVALEQALQLGRDDQLVGRERAVEELGDQLLGADDVGSGLAGGGGLGARGEDDEDGLLGGGGARVGEEDAAAEGVELDGGGGFGLNVDFVGCVGGGRRPRLRDNECESRTSELSVQPVTSPRSTLTPARPAPRQLTCRTFAASSRVIRVAPSVFLPFVPSPLAARSWRARVVLCKGESLEAEAEEVLAKPRARQGSCCSRLGDRVNDIRTGWVGLGTGGGFSWAGALAWG